MGQWIHYEADIFFLVDSIHLLKRNLSLEVDAAYFAEKVISDIKFIDQQLTGLFKSIQSSTYLLDRNRYIRSLYKAKQAFAELMEAIATGTLGSQIGLAPYAEEFRRLAAGQIDESGRLLSGDEADQDDDEMISKISQEEFKFLFMDGDHT
jgi:hypothetical protein